MPISPIADELFECVWPFCGIGLLKGLTCDHLAKSKGIIGIKRRQKQHYNY